MAKLIGNYKNGNYWVSIYSDGTKVRANNEDNFKPEFPESIDMKISDRCDMGCPFCHEQSTPKGELANLNHPILNSLPPYTELALGGGNILEHEALVPFLVRMKKQKVICNITLHLKHFENYYMLLRDFSEAGLIHGVGISVNNDINEKQIKMIEDMPNAVVHVIAGVVRYSTLMKLANHNIKLLILGYKTFGRGEKYFNELSDTIRENIDYMYKHMYELREWFPIISFDNLAIKQLHLQEIVDKDIWAKSYMGDDGQYTMYIDLVKQEYAVSSTSVRHPINDITDIKELFRKINT